MAIALALFDDMHVYCRILRDDEMKATAEDLIVWSRAVDRQVKAAKTEEEREKWEFRRALREEIADNEVDWHIKRLLIPWYFFNQPLPVIPILDRL